MFCATQTKITIHTRRSVKEKNAASWALEVAKKSIDYYETNYFQDSNPVPPKIGIRIEIIVSVGKKKFNS